MLLAAPMKTALAILTCLLLVFGQRGGWWAEVSTVVRDQPCQHCNCGGTGCCVGETSPAPPSSPVLPPGPSAQLDELAGSVARASVFNVPALDCERHRPPAFHAPILSAVPLRARFCCFLI